MIFSELKNNSRTVKYLKSFFLQGCIEKNNAAVPSIIKYAHKAISYRHIYIGYRLIIPIPGLEPDIIFYIGVYHKRTHKTAQLLSPGVFLA